MEASVKAFMEASVEDFSVEVTSMEASAEIAPVEAFAEASVEAFMEASVEAFMKDSVEAFLEASVEAYTLPWKRWKLPWKSWKLPWKQ